MFGKRTNRLVKDDKARIEKCSDELMQVPKQLKDTVI